MTRDEIIAKISTDYNFAMQFAVDNNLVGVIQVLSSYGYTGGNSKAFALSILKGLFDSGKVDQLKEMLNKVRYMNGTDNYTGGLADYFMRTTPPELYPTQNPEYRLSWNGMLSALGVGLSTYAAATAPTVTGAVAAANAAEIEAKRKQDEADKERKTYITIGIVVGAIVLIGVLIAVFSGKKKKD